MDRKSYMRFHLAPLSLTLSELERSIQVTGLAYISKSIQDNQLLLIFQRAVTWKPLQLRLNLLLMRDRKSHMVFHLATFALT